MKDILGIKIWKVVYYLFCHLLSQSSNLKILVKMTKTLGISISLNRMCSLCYHNLSMLSAEEMSRSTKMQVLKLKWVPSNKYLVTIK